MQEQSARHDLIVLLGATATGKTRMAAQLAARLDAEILSADSRQVYRGMDIGTGKDLTEYIVDGKTVPSHLIDLVDPNTIFSVFDYQRCFYDCYRDIIARGRLPLMVGGTGLYIESILRGYHLPPVQENIQLRAELAQEDLVALADRLRDLKPSLHNTTDLCDRERLLRAIEIALYDDGSKNGVSVSGTPVHPLIMGICWERAELRQRITERLHSRLHAGMVEEVQSLRLQGVSWERLRTLGLEYRYVSEYLQGNMNYPRMVDILNTRIHQFAKRQETWFRRMERLGIRIHWVPGDDFASLLRIVEEQRG